MVLCFINPIPFDLFRFREKHINPKILVNSQIPTPNYPFLAPNDVVIASINVIARYFCGNSINSEMELV